MNLPECPAESGFTEVWLDNGDRSDLLALVDDGMTSEEYWIGDLHAGIEFAMQDHYARVVALENHLGGETTRFSVYLGQNELITTCEEQSVPGEADMWGNGPTLEIAWRYVLAHVYGPADSEYDEPWLLSLLARWTDPAPERMIRSEVERWLTR